jgi:hypothetical protein
LNSIGRLSAGPLGDLSYREDDDAGARLLLGILPRQHYDRSRLRYEAAKSSQPGIAAFNGVWYPRLKGCAGGFEAFTTHERLFVATDWHIMVWVKHPIDFSRERPDIASFEENLRRYLRSLEEFLNEAGVSGPYAITFAIDGMDEIANWSRPGMASEIGDSRPSIVENLADPQVIGDFITQVRSALYY